MLLRQTPVVLLSIVFVSLVVASIFIFFLFPSHEKLTQSKCGTDFDLPATTTLQREVPLNSTNPYIWVDADVLVLNSKLEVRKVSERYSGKYDVAWKSQYPSGIVF